MLARDHKALNVLWVLICKCGIECLMFFVVGKCHSEVDEDLA